MKNEGRQWQSELPEFLLEAETLLAKADECLSHLHLIRNDSDAIECLIGILNKLANRAHALALSAIDDFSQHIHDLLSNSDKPLELHDQALDVLAQCLTLLAWQLELIDCRTGALTLDDSEQALLIEAFAKQLGTSKPTCAHAPL